MFSVEVKGETEVHKRRRQRLARSVPSFAVMVEWSLSAKGAPLLFVSVAIFVSLSQTDSKCHLNMSDMNDCDQQMEYIHTGQFHENFLIYPKVDNFEALCSMYQKWFFCMRSALMRCNGSSSAAAAVVELDIGQSKNILLQTCTVKRERALSNLLCLSTQSRENNHLFNGCFVMMQIRKRSQIVELCRLTSEYLQCEDRLIRSACGSAIADFRLAVSMETALNPTSLNQQCLYIPSSHYLGFEYTINCPPEFPELMRMCYKDFMNTRVVFYPTLLAVVKNPTENIDTWCSSLDQYKQCLTPIEAQCMDGVREIYTVSSDWNKHLHIAEYICQIASSNYKRFLPCYVRAVRSSTYPNLCRQLFDAYPARHELYAAKCLPNSTKSIGITDLRHKLIDCYAGFVQKECGRTARDTIMPLIRMQYSLDFLPPCYQQNATELPPTPVCACSQIKNRAETIQLPREMMLFIVSYTTVAAAAAAATAGY